MSDASSRRIALLCSAVALLITGCANEVLTTPVSQIVADRNAHMNSNEFSWAALEENVRRAVAAARVPAPALPPPDLLIDRFVTRGSSSTVARGLVSFKAVGDGLYHVLTEYQANEIPFRTNFALCYLGLDCLTHQSVIHSARRGDGLFITRKVDALTPGRHAPVEGAEYVIDREVTAKYEFRISLEPYRERQVCRAGGRYPATRLHHKLAGEAVDLACEIHLRDVLQGRSRVTILIEYGIGIEVEQVSTGFISKVVVVDVPSLSGPAAPRGATAT